MTRGILPTCMTHGKEYLPYSVLGSEPEDAESIGTFSLNLIKEDRYVSA